MLKKYISNNLLIIYIVIIILALIFIILYKNANKKIVQEETRYNTVSYTDPANHFTLSITSNWTNTSDFGKQTTGIGTGHEQIARTEITSLSTGSIGINLSVYEKAPVCDNAIKPNTIIAGLPAYFDAKHYSWTINTTDSTIVIGYFYPGAGVYHRRNMGSTPVPPSEMFASQKIINDIILTLKFSNSQPLLCP